MNANIHDVVRHDTSLAGSVTNGSSPLLMGAHKLLGDDVYNRDGEKLGDIKEFMVEMATGHIAYAVLSFGGVMGLGDKLFAVPWAALSLDSANKRFTLDVTKDALKDAPGFSKDRWPSMSDKTWADGLHTFYGTPLSRP